MKKFFSVTVIFVLTFVFTACAFAADKKDTVKFNKGKLKKIELVTAPAHGSPMIVMRENYSDVPLFGEATATQQQMINFINKRNPNPKINCTVPALVNLYWIEASREGIRPDIAMCQAIKETGTWAYGGDVIPEQNNYCGLGTTGGGVKGAFFPNPQIGVRAHIQHLLSYASKRPPKVDIVDPRYELIKKFRPQIFGKLTKWTELNGVWAVPGHHYGEDILNLWLEAQMPDGSDDSLNAADLKVFLADDKAAAHVYRGLVNLERENFSDARDDFQIAVDTEPELTEALFDLALAQEKLNKFDDAIKTYDALLTVDEKFVDAWHNRGCLKLAKDDFDGAIKDFETALKIETINADAYNNIAVAYFRRKKYDDAWTNIQKAAEQSTSNEVVKANYEKFSACVKVKKKK
ncbi:MAG: glucosaminidase domain-containing protein [Selenomonadaceae bacterium]|nr:glucosaminidase domain-containing protein [Selenomonadaceae bacterium]